MAVSGTSGVGQDVKVASPDQVGFNGLKSEDFMKMLITQLQNQDPTAPMSNEQLLNQISMMRNLQSNLELGDSLKAVTLNQQLSGAATFIGKIIKATTDDQREITGLVDRVVLKNGEAFLGIGKEEVRFKNVTEVNAAT